MTDVDLHKAFLDNALRFYADPPENGHVEIGVKDPVFLKRLSDTLYEHNEQTRQRKDPIVKPGNKPDLYVRWAFKRKGISVNIEMEAAEDRIGLTVLGTF